MLPSAALTQPLIRLNPLGLAAYSRWIFPCSGKIFPLLWLMDNWLSPYIPNLAGSKYVSNKVVLMETKYIELFERASYLSQSL